MTFVAFTEADAESPSGRPACLANTLDVWLAKISRTGNWRATFRLTKWLGPIDSISRRIAGTSWWQVTTASAGRPTGTCSLVYALAKNNLGHMQPGNCQIVQSFQAAENQILGGLGGLAYWNNSADSLLHVWSMNDRLKVYRSRKRVVWHDAYGAEPLFH